MNIEIVRNISKESLDSMLKEFLIPPNKLSKLSSEILQLCDGSHSKAALDQLVEFCSSLIRSEVPSTVEHESFKFKEDPRIDQYLYDSILEYLTSLEVFMDSNCNDLTFDQVCSMIASGLIAVNSDPIFVRGVMETFQLEISSSSCTYSDSDKIFESWWNSRNVKLLNIYAFFVSREIGSLTNTLVLLVILLSAIKQGVNLKLCSINSTIITHLKSSKLITRGDIDFVNDAFKEIERLCYFQAIPRLIITRGTPSKCSLLEIQGCAQGFIGNILCNSSISKYFYFEAKIKGELCPDVRIGWGTVHGSDIISKPGDLKNCWTIDLFSGHVFHDSITIAESRNIEKLGSESVVGDIMIVNDLEKKLNINDTEDPLLIHPNRTETDPISVEHPSNSVLYSTDSLPNPEVAAAHCTNSLSADAAIISATSTNSYTTPETSMSSRLILRTADAVTSSTDPYKTPDAKSSQPVPNTSSPLTSVKVETMQQNETSQEDIFVKYNNLRALNLPDGAIRIKMLFDGISPEEIESYLLDNPESSDSKINSSTMLEGLLFGGSSVSDLEGLTTYEVGGGPSTSDSNSDGPPRLETILQLMRLSRDGSSTRMTSKRAGSEPPLMSILPTKTESKYENTNKLTRQQAFSWAFDLGAQSIQEFSSPTPDKVKEFLSNALAPNGIIGSLLNLEENILSFFYQGLCLCEIPLDVSLSASGFRPVFSCVPGVTIEFNLGQSPFQYPQDNTDQNKCIQLSKETKQVANPTSDARSSDSKNRSSLNQGQYVRIQHIGDLAECGIIQISQIAIFGTEGENLAVGKVAEYYISNTAVSLCNNIISGEMLCQPIENSFFQPQQSIADYVQVDLGQLFEIQKIDYYNISDAESHSNSSGLQIEILDHNKSIMWQTVCVGIESMESFTVFQQNATNISAKVEDTQKEKVLADSSTTKCCFTIENITINLSTTTISVSISNTQLSGQEWIEAAKCSRLFLKNHRATYVKLESPASNTVNSKMAHVTINFDFKSIPTSHIASKAKFVFTGDESVQSNIFEFSPLDYLKANTGKNLKPSKSTNSPSNRKNNQMSLGKDNVTYYCGKAINSWDGERCGPSVGSQCPDCKGFIHPTPICMKKHVMDLCLSCPEEYGGTPICDGCRERDICRRNRFIYHCRPCGYDLCDSCSIRSSINSKKSTMDESKLFISSYSPPTYSVGNQSISWYLSLYQSRTSNTSSYISLNSGKYACSLSSFTLEFSFRIHFITDCISLKCWDSLPKMFPITCFQLHNASQQPNDSSIPSNDDEISSDGHNCVLYYNIMHGSFSYQVDGNEILLSPNGLVDVDSWHHVSIALSRDNVASATTYLYLDGNFLQKTSFQTTKLSKLEMDLENVSIGDSKAISVSIINDNIPGVERIPDTTSSVSDLSIDCCLIRLWSNCQSIHQVQNNFGRNCTNGSESNLLVCATFSEGAGTVLYDSSFRNGNLITTDSLTVHGLFEWNKFEVLSVKSLLAKRVCSDSIIDTESTLDDCISALAYSLSSSVNHYEKTAQSDFESIQLISVFANTIEDPKYFNMELFVVILELINDNISRDQQLFQELLIAIIRALILNLKKFPVSSPISETTIECRIIVSCLKLMESTITNALVIDKLVEVITTVLKLLPKRDNFQLQLIAYLLQQHGELSIHISHEKLIMHMLHGLSGNVVKELKIRLLRHFSIVQNAFNLLPAFLVAPHYSSLVDSTFLLNSKEASDNLSPENFIGSVVERGPDWVYNDQDSGLGSKGIVIDVNNWIDGRGTAMTVLWANGSSNTYRWGVSDSIISSDVSSSKKYDLRSVAINPRNLVRESTLPLEPPQLLTLSPTQLQEAMNRTMSKREVLQVILDNSSEFFKTRFHVNVPIDDLLVMLSDEEIMILYTKLYESSSSNSARAECNSSQIVLDTCKLLLCNLQNKIDCFHLNPDNVDTNSNTCNFVMPPAKVITHADNYRHDSEVNLLLTWQGLMFGLLGPSPSHDYSSPSTVRCQYFGAYDRVIRKPFESDESHVWSWSWLDGCWQKSCSVLDVGANYKNDEGKDTSDNLLTNLTLDSGYLSDSLLVSKDCNSVQQLANRQWSTILGSIAIEPNSGVHKWYSSVERIGSKRCHVMFGVATIDVDLDSFIGQDSESWGITLNKEFFHGGTKISFEYGSKLKVDTIIEIILDTDQGNLSINDPSSSYGPTVVFQGLQNLTLYPAWSLYGPGDTVILHTQLSKPRSVQTSSNNKVSTSSQKNNLSQPLILNKFGCPTQYQMKYILQILEISMQMLDKNDYAVTHPVLSMGLMSVLSTISRYSKLPRNFEENLLNNLNRLVRVILNVLNSIRDSINFMSAKSTPSVSTSTKIAHTKSVNTEKLLPIDAEKVSIEIIDNNLVLELLTQLGCLTCLSIGNVLHISLVGELHPNNLALYQNIASDNVAFEMLFSHDLKQVESCLHSKLLEKGLKSSSVISNSVDNGDTISNFLLCDDESKEYLFLNWLLFHNSKFTSIYKSSSDEFKYLLRGLFIVILYHSGCLPFFGELIHSFPAELTVEDLKRNELPDLFKDVCSKVTKIKLEMSKSIQLQGFKPSDACANAVNRVKFLLELVPVTNSIIHGERQITEKSYGLQELLIMANSRAFNDNATDSMSSISELCLNFVSTTFSINYLKEYLHHYSAKMIRRSRSFESLLTVLNEVSSHLGWGAKSALLSHLPNHSRIFPLSHVYPLPSVSSSLFRNELFHYSHGLQCCNTSMLRSAFENLLRYLVAQLNFNVLISASESTYHILVLLSCITNPIYLKDHALLLDVDILASLNQIMKHSKSKLLSNSNSSIHPDYSSVFKISKKLFIYLSMQIVLVDISRHESTNSGFGDSFEGTTLVTLPETSLLKQNVFELLYMELDNLLMLLRVNLEYLTAATDAKASTLDSKPALTTIEENQLSVVTRPNLFHLKLSSEHAHHITDYSNLLLSFMVSNYCRDLMTSIKWIIIFLDLTMLGPVETRQYCCQLLYYTLPQLSVANLDESAHLQLTEKLNLYFKFYSISTTNEALIVDRAQTSLLTLLFHVSCPIFQTYPIITCFHMDFAEADEKARAATLLSSLVAVQAEMVSLLRQLWTNSNWRDQMEQFMLKTLLTIQISMNTLNDLKPYSNTQQLLNQFFSLLAIIGGLTDAPYVGGHVFIEDEAGRPSDLGVINLIHETADLIDIDGFNLFENAIFDYAMPYSKMMDRRIKPYDRRFTASVPTSRLRPINRTPFETIIISDSVILSLVPIYINCVKLSISKSKMPIFIRASKMMLMQAFAKLCNIPRYVDVIKENIIKDFESILDYSVNLTESGGLSDLHILEGHLMTIMIECGRITIESELRNLATFQPAVVEAVKKDIVNSDDKPILVRASSQEFKNVHEDEISDSNLVPPKESQDAEEIFGVSSSDLGLLELTENEFHNFFAGREEKPTKNNHIIHPTDSPASSTPIHPPPTPVSNFSELPSINHSLNQSLIHSPTQHEQQASTDSKYLVEAVLTNSETLPALDPHATTASETETVENATDMGPHTFPDTEELDTDDAVPDEGESPMLDTLLSMGFDRATSVVALRICGDIDEALNYMLSHESELQRIVQQSNISSTSRSILDNMLSADTVNDNDHEDEDDEEYDTDMDQLQSLTSSYPLKAVARENQGRGLSTATSTRDSTILDSNEFDDPPREFHYLKTCDQYLPIFAEPTNTAERIGAVFPGDDVFAFREYFENEHPKSCWLQVRLSDYEDETYDSLNNLLNDSNHNENMNRQRQQEPNNDVYGWIQQYDDTDVQVVIPGQSDTNHDQIVITKSSSIVIDSSFEIRPYHQIVVRKDHDPSSAVLGTLKPGDIISAIEERFNSAGSLCLRIVKPYNGWVVKVYGALKKITDAGNVSDSTTKVEIKPAIATLSDEWSALERVDDNMEHLNGKECYRKEDRMFGTLQGLRYQRYHENQKSKVSLLQQRRNRILGTTNRSTSRQSVANSSSILETLQTTTDLVAILQVRKFLLAILYRESFIKDDAESTELSIVSQYASYVSSQLISNSTDDENCAKKNLQNLCKANIESKFQNLSKKLSYFFMLISFRGDPYYSVNLEHLGFDDISFVAIPPEILTVDILIGKFNCNLLQELSSQGSLSMFHDCLISSLLQSVSSHVRQATQSTNHETMWLDFSYEDDIDNDCITQPNIHFAVWMSKLLTDTNDYIFDVFKIWCLGGLRSSSMSLKHITFEMLSDILTMLHQQLINCQSNFENSDCADYSVKLPNLVNLLQTCLDTLPTVRLEVMASRRLWHEMEDAPSFSRYIQSLLHLLSEARASTETIIRVTKLFVTATTVRPETHTGVDRVPQMHSNQRPIVSFRNPSSHIQLNPQKEVAGSWTLEMWIRRSDDIAAQTSVNVSTLNEVAKSIDSKMKSWTVSTCTTSGISDTDLNDETEVILTQVPVNFESSEKSILPIEEGALLHDQLPAFFQHRKLQSKLLLSNDETKSVAEFMESDNFHKSDQSPKHIDRDSSKADSFEQRFTKDEILTKRAHDGKAESTVEDAFVVESASRKVVPTLNLVYSSGASIKLQSGGELFDGLSDPQQLADFVNEKALCFSLYQKGVCDVTFDFVVPRHEWVHISVVSRTCPSNTIELYVNGDLKDRVSAKFTLPIAYIGSPKSGEGFAGDVADFRVWSLPRSAYEIKRDMNVDVTDMHGLILYLPCNEGSGNRITDTAGFLNSCNLTFCSWTTENMPIMVKSDLPSFILNEPEEAEGIFGELVGRSVGTTELTGIFRRGAVKGALGKMASDEQEIVTLCYQVASENSECKEIVGYLNWCEIQMRSVVKGSISTDNSIQFSIPSKCSVYGPGEDLLNWLCDLQFVGKILDDKIVGNWSYDSLVPCPPPMKPGQATIDENILPSSISYNPKTSTLSIKDDVKKGKYVVAVKIKSMPLKTQSKQSFSGKLESSTAPSVPSATAHITYVTSCTTHDAPSLLREQISSSLTNFKASPLSIDQPPLTRESSFLEASSPIPVSSPIEALSPRQSSIESEQYPESEEVFSIGVNEGSYWLEWEIVISRNSIIIGVCDESFLTSSNLSIIQQSSSKGSPFTENPQVWSYLQYGGLSYGHLLTEKSKFRDGDIIGVQINSHRQIIAFYRNNEFVMEFDQIFANQNVNRLRPFVCLTKGGDRVVFKGVKCGPVEITYPPFIYVDDRVLYRKKFVGTIAHGDFHEYGEMHYQDSNIISFGKWINDYREGSHLTLSFDDHSTPSVTNNLTYYYLSTYSKGVQTTKMNIEHLNDPAINQTSTATPGIGTQSEAVTKERLALSTQSTDPDQALASACESELKQPLYPITDIERQWLQLADRLKSIMLLLRSKRKVYSDSKASNIEDDNNNPDRATLKSKPAGKKDGIKPSAITIRLRDKSMDMNFKVSTSVKLKKVVDIYSKKRGMSYGDYKYTFKNQELNLDNTPELLDMVDDDIIYIRPAEKATLITDTELVDKLIETSTATFILHIILTNGATVRSGIEIEENSQVRSLKYGEVVEAYQKAKTKEGVVRYRISDGWISERLRGGGEDLVVRVLRETLSTPERYEIIRKGGAKVRASHVLSSEDRGFIPENTVIEAVEKRIINEDNEFTNRLKIQSPPEWSGWVSEKSHIVKSLSIDIESKFDKAISAELNRRSQVRAQRSALNVVKMTADVSDTANIHYKRIKVMGSITVSSETLFLLTSQHMREVGYSISSDALTVTCDGKLGGKTMAFGSRGFSRGVHYWEVQVDSAAWGNVFLGVAPAEAKSWGGYGFINYRATQAFGNETLYGSYYGSGDTVGVLLDMDHGTIAFVKDGQYLDKTVVIHMGTAYHNLRTKHNQNRSTNITLYPCFGMKSVGDQLSLRKSKWVSIKGLSPRQLLEQVMVSKNIISIWRQSYNISSKFCRFPSSVVNHLYTAYNCWRGHNSLLVKSRAGIDVSIDVSSKALVEALASTQERYCIRPGSIFDSPYGRGHILGTRRKIQIWYVLESGESGAWYWLSSELTDLADSATVTFDSESALSPTSQQFSTPIQAPTNSQKAEYLSLFEYTHLLCSSQPWTQEEDRAIAQLVNNIADSSGCDPMHIPVTFMELYRLKSNILSNRMPQEIYIRYSALCVLNRAFAVSLPLIDLSCKDNRVPLVCSTFVESIFNRRATESGSGTNKNSPTLFERSISGISSISLKHLIFTQIKRKHWQHALIETKTHTSMPADEFERPEDIKEIQINRPEALEAERMKSSLSFTDRLKMSVFGQIYDSLKIWDDRSLRRGFIHVEDEGQQRAFFVKFIGEGVDDHGGPYRAVFQSAIGEEPMNLIELLKPCANSVADIGDNRDRFIMNGHLFSQETLQLYTFFGKVLALSCRHNIEVPLSLAMIIWKPLISERVDVNDLKMIDTLSVSGIHALLSSEMDSSMVHDLVYQALYEVLTLPITISSSKPLTTDQISFTADSTFLSNTIITNLMYGSNSDINMNVRSIPKLRLKKLCDLILHLKLTSHQVAMKQLYRGLSAVIPMEILNILSVQEVERLFGGEPDVNIDALKKTAQYEGVSPGDRHIQLFWKALEKLNIEERGQFINFCSGRSRLPSAVKDFPMRFKLIAPPAGSEKNPDHYLPISRTCFFNLSLPKYSTLEVCLEKLKYAIKNTNLMDADFALRNADGWQNVRS